MGRVAVVLLALLVLSGLYLVQVAYEERRLFAELNKAQDEAQRLEAEFSRLKAQAQAQAAPLRVERLAKDKLDMRVAMPVSTLYVQAEAAGASQPGGQP
jgi:cell division protein FtsL